MKDNQSGMTLVELLAVLVLVSLVTGIIWTAMNISVKHNALETTKIQLQQDANFIITKIQQKHRSSECYRLIIEEQEVSLRNCEGNQESTEIIGQEFQYGPLQDIELKPKKTSMYELTLEVKDPLNRRLSVSVPTVISRYKSE
ncbi:prepilin-type N-terminal cleavage/methylation domain-containing protein [Sporosarcina sp. ZBG7A]|uniref:prepilin-type N-terminal cleavage/methylation domain-containing protein n=1 Tax=Sporosarcina sp. ZBG7A TaxID=1582223 RepID=UPI00057A183C|nr:prepilin-type N-terminal cleavage/methylation domain-containing protein [Sporosarcina sp. ZBG7A]